MRGGAPEPKTRPPGAPTDNDISAGPPGAERSFVAWAKWVVGLYETLLKSGTLKRLSPPGVGDCWRLVAVGGWRLVTVGGGWQLAVGGGWWWLAVGGW